MRRMLLEALRTVASGAIRRLDIRPVALHGGNLVTRSRRREGRRRATSGETGQLPDLWYIEACEEWAAAPRRRSV